VRMRGQSQAFIRMPVILRGMPPILGVPGPGSWLDRRVTEGSGQGVAPGTLSVVPTLAEHTNLTGTDV